MVSKTLQQCKILLCVRAGHHMHVHAGVAHWRESLSQISTIYTDAKHAADVEEKVGFGNCNLY